VRRVVVNYLLELVYMGYDTTESPSTTQAC